MPQYLIFSKVELDEKEIIEIPELLRYHKDLVVVLKPKHLDLIQSLMRLYHVCVIKGGVRFSFDDPLFFRRVWLHQNSQGREGKGEFASLEGVP